MNDDMTPGANTDKDPKDLSMKISELRTDWGREVIFGYCGISDRPGEVTVPLESARDAAIAFVKSYTGIPEEELDDYEDLTPVCLCLINEMFNNRSLTVNTATLNPYVVAVLAMHSRNLLA